MFVELPFEPKQHLISYHIEGQGEDREVPLLSTPWMISAPQTIAMGLKGANTTMAVHNMAAVSNMSAFGGMYLDYEQTEMVEVDSMDMTYFQGMAEHSVYLDNTLPDRILDNYYSQKASCAAQNYSQKDSLLLYDYEGQGSPVGSVGCCSLLESDNDLQFLSDLGPKFRTLAEVCSLPKPVVEGVVDPGDTDVERLPKTTIPRSRVSIHPSGQSSSSNLHTSQASTSNLNQSSTSNLIRQPVPLSPPAGQTILVQQHVPLSPPAGQTILVQQPMYYTPTPMLQPMHYVVEPQVHNTVLLAERPAANLQGMIVVNGPPPGPAQGQGMVLVERSGENHSGIQALSA
ncbi:desmoglein-2.1-like [Osmerus mordax]|uniref:desmoglein-2.1-like n=1 Tax=Osmerus mordax TaxID=8014 RepID=UPI00350FA1E1